MGKSFHRTGRGHGPSSRSTTMWNAVAKEATRRARRAVDRAAVAEGESDCHCGHPPAGLAFDPRWRTAVVLALARSIAATHDYAGLPVLADALEEAGCGDPAVLNHCRHPVRHVRGCWVVDLIG
jgi:hypothetical protein